MFPDHTPTVGTIGGGLLVRKPAVNSVSCLLGHKMLFSNHQCRVINDPTADPKGTLPARDEKSKLLTPGHTLGTLPPSLARKTVCGHRGFVASTSHNYPQTPTHAGTSPSLFLGPQRAMGAGHISIAGVARELPPNSSCNNDKAHRLPHCSLYLLRRPTYLRSAAPFHLPLSYPFTHWLLDQDW